MSRVPESPGPADLSVEEFSVEQTMRRLSQLGRDFNARVAPVLARIRELDAQQPWGAGDETGKAFTTKVYYQPLGDGTPYHEALKTMLAQAGLALDGTGSGGRVAVNLYREADRFPHRSA